VPKVSVYENDHPRPREHDVWTPGKALDVLSEAIASTVQFGTNNRLDIGVPISHPRHAVGSLFFSEVIRHQS
jgi:hypothetical protein